MSASPALQYDAIVVGSGPAGATAALLLSRSGWRVAIVEKAAFPRRKVCGEFVSATTWPLLDALGVGDELRGQAGPVVRRVGVFARTSMVTGVVGPVVAVSLTAVTTLAPTVTFTVAVEQTGVGVEPSQTW